jgi:hypothetical protein
MDRARCARGQSPIESNPLSRPHVCSAGVMNGLSEIIG